MVVKLVASLMNVVVGKVAELLRLGQQDGIRIRVNLGWSPPPALPPYRLYREGMVLDVGCWQARAVVAQASASRAFNLRHSWLLLDDKIYNFTRLDDILSDVAILPDGDVSWVSSDMMKDVYRVKADQPMVVTNLGERCDRRDLAKLWRALPTAATRRKDLNNVYLKSATIISQPQYFKGWSDLSDRQIDTFPKLTNPLLMLCAEDLHFRYNLKQVDLYGEERNGTFNGLVGQMQRGELEVGITSMFMRSDRWRVVHFCAETVELRGAFLFRQPARATVSNVFVLPFGSGVWAACGAVWVCAGALLALVGALARAAPLLTDRSLARLTPPECFSFTVGIVCQQGSDLSPKLLSVRVLVFCSLLSSLFVFTSYSAKIVAIIQAPSNAIQSIADLTHSPMDVGVQETTYKKVYFAESSDPATRALFKRKLQPLGERAYLSVVEGIARVRRGLFAFQVEQSSAYDIISKTYTEREKCSLKEIKAFTLPMVAVPLRKHSGYRDLFAARLRWQREVGLMDRWKRVWMTGRARCGGGGGGTDSVPLAAVLPAAHALLAGAGTALVLLLLERLHAGLRTGGLGHR